MPLKQKRSVRLVADLAEETASEFHKHVYVYDAIGIILLEGIFLFKPAFVHQFDLKIWIECSFETALERAVSRSQEGLSPAETIEAFRTTYFPAQKIHFEEDKPGEAADTIFANY